MTRAMEDVATSPVVGDVVVLRSGHVRYTVKDTGGAVGVCALREQVRPDKEPDYVSLCSSVWADLVRFAACSVETSS